ncbi:hypothetical protein [Erythrobacter sp. SG61-1L]|uniref:CC_3452 family protein n=1 Tax=Erythrobacter sp. SG61-1L TaxID=1603897 RepID=UPI0006C9290B|nr:hypothetical protein [Erythrobacter sp. SG61-1L]
MIRLFSSARRANAAFFVSTLVPAGAFAGLAPTPAAATGNAYYRAELASPLAEPRREILNGVIWSCSDNSCTGTKGGSRAELECARLAQKVGPIAAFAKGEAALDGNALARCNK